MMDSFENPVGGGSRDPYGKFRVEPAGERQSRGNGPEPPDDRPPKEKLKFAAYVLSLFQRAVDFFLERHRGSGAAAKDPLSHLRALKISFEILKKEDRSQDVQFLNELSTIWIALLEDSLHFGREDVESKFKLLVKKILSYPDNLPHSFGYYLTEYAGQKWVPFPYMELIQKIHKEHEKNPTGSVLTEWILLIGGIIRLLNNE